VKSRGRKKTSIWGMRTVNLQAYLPDPTSARHRDRIQRLAIPWSREYFLGREDFLARCMTKLREDLLNPVLFLDDMAVRHAASKGFMKRVLGLKELPEIWRAQDAERALDLMRSHNFHAVFLDHDLADAHYVGGGGYMEGSKIPDGSWLARQMLDLPDEQRPALVVVHSWNPEGGAYMTETLSRAGFNVQRVEFGA
jgi:NAD+-processing family protein with receiver domain